jgi:hypothetical protein
MGIGIAIEKSQSVVNLWKSSKVRFGSPASGIYPLIANEVGVHRARVFRRVVGRRFAAEFQSRSGREQILVKACSAFRLRTSRRSGYTYAET